MKKTISPAVFPARLLTAICLVLLCAYAGKLRAQTIRYVKPVSTGTGDGSSWANATKELQLMITNSAYDDTIFVAAGTYETLFLSSFSLKNGVKIYGGFVGTETQLSQRDWATNVTILKANSGPAVLNSDNGVTSASILDGFTITGANLGSPGFGGGMYNYRVSPTIANCTFKTCRAFYGGGMYNERSSPVIINSSFSTNNAKTRPIGAGGGGGYGSGIYNTLFSSPSLSGCTFTSNNAEVSGGGMYSELSSAPTLTNCNFFTNTASSSGGGMTSSSPFATIINCKFSGNVTPGIGGAVFNDACSPIIRSCTFSGNTAEIGGAMYNSTAFPDISNCIFSGNKAFSRGGSMYNIYNSNPFIFNCTFSGNNASAPGAIFNNGTSWVSIHNSIIWGNNSGIYDDATLSTIDFSIIQGGYPGLGNLNVDPLFANAPSYTTAPFIDGNYTIQPCSPPFNAGNNALILPGTTTDIAGNPRINMTIDMGAYEYTVRPGNNNTLYINPGVTSGNGDGSSWANALRQIPEAILYAKANEGSWFGNPLKIFVAKGVYKPLYRPDNGNVICAGTNANDRDNTFLMASSVQVYGGFDPANGIDDLTDTRIFGAGGSILSGDIGTVNNSSDNCHHVIIYSGGGNGARLDGFTITGGNANGSGFITVNSGTGTADRNNGGGIYLHGSQAIIANCIFSGNTTANWGGSIYGRVGSNFNASNCTFSNNTGVSGGAVFNDFTSPSLTNCTFSNNSAPYGGAILNNGGEPFITSCSFSGNTATSYGGAVYNSGIATPHYNNCTFSGNSALLGGGIFNNISTAAITGCSFSNNSASDNGGGIYNWAASFPSITNSTFLSNTAGLFGAGMFSESASAPTITGSLFAGNNTQFGGALYNGGNATVTSCRFANNWAASYGGAVYNHGLSPVYTSCLFSGNIAVNTGGGGGAMFNNNANPFVVNNTFSGNAATFGGAIHNYSTAVATVRNTVIWGNSSSIYNESGASATVGNTLIQGGYAGTGNMNVNPLFINTAVPAGADGIWGSLDDGLRPQLCSPIIDAGNNALITSGATTDIAGHARIQLVKVDLGAYEANSFANATAANIVTSNTVASGWQIPNAQTFYSTNCNTLIVAVTGDGTATSISGNTTAQVWIESAQPADFVKRHYEITPQAISTTSTATVTLYFTQAEFDAFNAVNTIKLPQGPSDAAGKANLLVEKRSGTSSNGTGLPFSYSGSAVTINPNDATIIWNATASRWEISFPVTGFSGFFVKTQLFTLPLRLVSFTAEEHNCITYLQWITKDEVSVSHFEVEQSTNGTLFSTVKTIQAKNNNSENNYSATVPVINNKMFYRLKMVDIDGKITYSPVAVVTAVCDNKVFLYPNPVKAKLYISNAAIGSHYEVYDNTGKRIGSGRIANTIQEIHIAGIASGIYFIRVTDEGGSSRSLRFVKE